MSISITVSSYPDFKAIVSGFEEKGQVFLGTSSSAFYLEFVGHKFDFLVIYAANGSPPTISADFPTAIILTSPGSAYAQLG